MEAKITKVNEKESGKHNDQELKDYLQSMFGSTTNGYINIRAIPNNGAANKPKEKFVRITSDFNKTAGEVIDIISKYSDYNIFFSPVTKSEQKGTTEYCSHASCLYSDFDDYKGKKFINMTYSERQELTQRLSAQLQRSEYPPSIIVRSGNGIHAYWLLTTVVDVASDRCRFEGVLKYLANTLPDFQGDKAVCSISHMLRMPYTLNYKDPDNVKQCKVIVSNYHIRYEYSEFSKLVQVAESSTNNAPGFNLYQKVMELEDLTVDELMKEIMKCEIMNHLYNKPEDQSYSAWCGIASTLTAFGEEGNTVFHEISRAYKNYDEDEAERLFNGMLPSIVEGKIGPITCSRMCGEVFQCKGNCNKQSIAGNIYSRLYKSRKDKRTDAAITAAIRKLEADNDKIKNLRKLNEFIDTVLNKHCKDEFVRTEYIKKAMKRLDVEGGTAMIKKLVKKQQTNSENAYIRIGDGVISRMTLISISKSFYNYSSGYYQPIDDEYLKSIIIEELGDDYTKSSVENILYYIISKTAINVEDTNKNKKDNIICLRNGMLSISSKGYVELLLHDSSYNCLNQLQITYVKDASCKQWLDFLNRSFTNQNDKEDVIRNLQEWFGYMLIPGNQLQKMLFLIGQPRTGKGVIQHIMSCIVGDENVTAYSISELHDKVNAATLIGKLANIGGEIDATERFKTSFIKMLIGQDKITGKALYKNPVSFQNEAKLIFAANQIPYISDRSSAMDERTLAISVDNYVPHDERDPELKTKLEQELSGILNWAIEGRIRLLERGYFKESESMLELKAKMREDNNSVVYWFNNKKGNMDKTKQYHTLKELFDDYKEFCTEEEIKPMIKRNFKTTLEAIAGIQVVKKTKPDQECVVLHWNEILRKTEIPNTTAEVDTEEIPQQPSKTTNNRVSVKYNQDLFD